MLDRIRRVFSSRPEKKPTGTTSDAPREPVAAEPATPEAVAPDEPAAEEKERSPGFGPPSFRTDSESPLVPAIIAALRKVYDPEIPIDVFEMGLVYGFDVSDAGAVSVRMTLTSPNCPAAVQIPADVETRVREVEGVTGCSVEVVWEPPWEKEMMSEAAMLQLGMI